MYLSRLAPDRSIAWELPFWLCATVWAFLPSTRTPWFEVASVGFSMKEILVVAICAVYLTLTVFLTLFMPPVHMSSAGIHKKQIWHLCVPGAAIALFTYAACSASWSGMNVRQSIAMVWTILGGMSAFTLAWCLVSRRSEVVLRSFLWRVTIFIALMSMVYSAEVVLFARVEKRGCCFV